MDDVIRVLLVEDDREDYIITRNLLNSAEGQRFKLTWFDRLQPALDDAGSGEVDVVLLDVTLPDSSGWETFESMRGRAPHLPLILLTGMADQAMGVRAVKEGAQDYLFKGTTDQDQLVRAIRYAIERKRAAESLKRYQDHLEELVAERTRELEEANRQLQREIGERREVETKLREAVARLEENNEAKSKFVSNVSHELKTPLASISYAVENLSKGICGPLNERVMTYVEMMSEDCRRLSGTVNDILDLTRLEANRLVLNRMKLPFGQFVRQTADSLLIQARTKGLEMAIAADTGSGFVYCDRQKMERVLLNVIGNAIKFTPEGGRVEVVLGCDPAEHSVIVLDVIDNGVGIAQEHLPRVTERYFRVGEHVTGSGLGLALSKEVVELHGGSLTVTSPPVGREQGTQVALRLPLASPPRVLAVDDDAMILDLLRSELTHHGYEVILCEDGVKAFELLKGRSPPDILIVDVLMPVMGGVELIAKVKADHELRRMPTVMITGHEMDDSRQEILAGFGVPTLRKPWRRRELIQCIEDAVMGRHFLTV
jgi:signal transduction histidine kinase